MRILLKILLGGFVIFMLLAIGQEWEYFHDSWFGEAGVTPSASVAEPEKAVAAVELTLTLMRHLYSSGGDRRFADRMPAAEGIVQEMLADIDYLARSRRRQDPVLKRLEVESVESIGEGRAEVQTRELWDVGFDWIDGIGESDPRRVQVMRSRYLVVRGSTGWRVEGWDFVVPERNEAEAEE